MIHRFPWVLLILIFVFYQAVATNVEEYEILLMEANILIQYNTPSDEGLALIDSAKSAALKSDYELAVVYLEVVIDEVYKKTYPTQDELKIIDYENSKNLDFKMHTGLDFNRQEFEVG